MFKLEDQSLGQFYSPELRSTLYDLRHEKTCSFFMCKNKSADQLCGNRTADLRLCFRNTASTIPLLSKFEISSL